MSFTEITWGSEKYKFNNDTMTVYDKNDKKVGTLVDGNIISITIICTSILMTRGKQLTRTF